MLILMVMLITISAISALGQLPAFREEIDHITASPQADTATLMLLKARAETYIDKQNRDSADVRMLSYIINSMSALASRLGNPVGLAISQLTAAKMYRVTGQPDRGRKASESAVQLLKGKGALSLEAEALIELGGTYSNASGDLPDKIRYYEAGTEIYARLGNRRKVAELKEFIGDLLLIGLQHDQAIKVLHESLALYKETGNKRLHGVYSPWQRLPVC